MSYSFFKHLLTMYELLLARSSALSQFQWRYFKMQDYYIRFPYIKQNHQSKENSPYMHELQQSFINSARVQQDYRFAGSTIMMEQLARQQSVTKNLVNSMSTATMLNNMDSILSLKSQAMTKAHYNFESLQKTNTNISGVQYFINSNSFTSDRDKYSMLLHWHHKQLSQIKNQLKSNKINNFQSLQKQQQLLNLVISVFEQHISKQCKQKALLIKILKQHHMKLYNSLCQYMDKRLKNNLTERVQAENRIQTDLNQEIKILKEQLGSLQHQKDKKWRNLFMLIKDNRILRRTRGKLLRQVQACNYRNQSLKQQIVQLTRQNERYKLLCHTSNDCHQEDGLQKWLKNLSSLMKIERYIQKQPLKAKRVLEFELQNLQISEMQNLPQKIQYIIKSIEQAEQLVDYYEDFNDLVTPCKLLLNSYSQTQSEREDVGVNTNISKFVNSYCQVRPHLILQNGLSIENETIKLPVNESHSKNSYGYGSMDKRKMSSMSNSNKSERIHIGNSLFGMHQKGNQYHMPYMRIVKSIQETIVPRYIPSTFQSSMNHQSKDMIYLDSKFLSKMSIHEKQVQITIRGLFGIVSSNPMNSSTSKPKRYTQLSSLTCQNELTLRQQNEQTQNSSASSTSRPYLQKRFSHNNLSIQNKLKRISHIDSASLMSKDFASIVNYRKNQDEKKYNSVIDHEHLSISHQESQCAVLNIPQNQPNNVKDQNAISQEHSILSDSSSQEAADKNVQTGAVKSKKKTLLKMKQKIQAITRHSTIGVIAGGSLKNKLRKDSSFVADETLKKERSSQRPVYSNKMSKRPSNNMEIPERLSIGINPRITVSSAPKNSRYSHQSKYTEQSNSYVLNANSSMCEQQQEENDTNSDDSGSRANNVTIKQSIFAKGKTSKNNKQGNQIRKSSQKLSQNPRKNNLYAYGMAPMDRKSSAMMMGNYRSSYMVAPIVEQNILQDNYNYDQQQEEQQLKQKQQKANMFNSAPNTNSDKTKNPVHLYFELEPQTNNIDVSKIVPKLVHLIYVNRVQLRGSYRTLKQYIYTNLKNMYGINPQSQFTSFNKSLSLSVTAVQPQSDTNNNTNNNTNLFSLCFTKMLNFNAPIAYQNDILKLYLMLMDKSGGQTMIVDLEKGTWIINYITRIFYNQKEVDQIAKQMQSILMIISMNNIGKSNTSNKSKRNNMNKLTNISINLNQYFLLLQEDLRRRCLRTQFMEFCAELMPENQNDLNLQQFSQLLRFMPNSLQLQMQMSRIKLYFIKSGQTSNRVNTNSTNLGNTNNNYGKASGMKLHKISLYCCREEWSEVKNIITVIETKFKATMEEIFCMEELIQLFVRLDKGQFGECMTKTVCPWIWGLVKNRVKSYKDYGRNVCKQAIMLIWLIEVNLKIQSMNMLMYNLEFLADRSRKLFIRQQLSQFYGPSVKDKTKKTPKKQSNKQNRDTNRQKTNDSIPVIERQRCKQKQRSYKKQQTNGQEYSINILGQSSHDTSQKKLQNSKSNKNVC